MDIDDYRRRHIGAIREAFALIPREKDQVLRAAYVAISNAAELDYEDQALLQFQKGVLYGIEQCVDASVDRKYSAATFAKDFPELAKQYQWKVDVIQQVFWALQLVREQLEYEDVRRIHGGKQMRSNVVEALTRLAREAPEGCA